MMNTTQPSLKIYRSPGESVPVESPRGRMDEDTLRQLAEKVASDLPAQEACDRLLLCGRYQWVTDAMRSGND